MILRAGDRIGPYEIGSKLEREVAVKVLPDAYSRDGDRIARFEREAKLLGALKHSNIATLYGLEETSIGHCRVMELVEGETLAERIARGPLRRTQDDLSRGHWKPGGRAGTPLSLLTASIGCGRSRSMMISIAGRTAHLI
jgi:serine/threonine protein kinase